MTKHSTHLPEADVSLHQLDEYLHQIIAMLQTLEPGTCEWQRAMNRLLSKIQTQPEFRRYCRLGCPEYLLDALTQTWQWLSRGGIKQFNLPQEPFGTWEKLVKWLQCPKSYLWWRVKEAPVKAERDRIRQLIPGWRSDWKDKDSKPRRSKQILSLDALIGDDEEVGTWLDMLNEQGQLVSNGGNFPSFPELERLAEELQTEKRQQFAFEIKKYVEEDPKNEFLNCCLRDQPDGVNVSQVLALRMSFKEPPDKLRVIARDLGMEDRYYSALHPHWNRKVKPLLQKIAEELANKIGYQLDPEEEL